MPYGFMGNAAQKYLSNVSDALSSAHSVHNVNPYKTKGSTSPPSPPARNNYNAKHSPDSAMSGGYPVRVGNQSNVVVSEDTYTEILGRIRTTDSAIAEELYNIAAQIESMCETSYIVPATLPKYLAIVNNVKSSLGEFQSLAEQAGTKAYEFMDEIMRIDRQS